MAGKRKIHRRTDLSISTSHLKDHSPPSSEASPRRIPPAETRINFGFSAEGLRSFDYAKYYGVNIDEITYAIQVQIERFLAKQDAELEVSTIAGYASRGSRTFLNYLKLVATERQHELTLADIDRGLIDGFISHLNTSNRDAPSRSTVYHATKQIIRALGRRGLVAIVHAGEQRTFPRSPFPNAHRHPKGEKPLPRKQRREFTAAVKTAVMPLFREDVVVTSELLTYGLLVLALHTGRNTTPLLEMTSDCLRPHPRQDLQFLILWKRRGHNTSKVSIRAETTIESRIESMPSVNLPVIRLVKRVIDLSHALRSEAPPHLQERVWLYRSRERQNIGAVTALTAATIHSATRKLIANAGLKDSDGNPLRINVSRLRKTFGNRIFEILDGDLGSTAIALGNTPTVAGRNYMMPTEESRRNWKFLGEFLTNELLTNSLGSSERTPVGRCTDAKDGQYAPKRDEQTCFSFLDCLRCRNYAVSEDDLYRLFSFYWRVLRERDRVDRRVWSKHYAHIPRLIERDVVEAGLKMKIFSAASVEGAREQARIDPHPFWRNDSLGSLEDLRTGEEGA